MPNDYIDSILAECARRVGMAEWPRGSNRGPELEAWLQPTGFHPGEPWCAYSVSRIGMTLGSAWPLPITGDCDVLLEFARKKRILHATPQRGDVFLVCASGVDATHTGFVKAGEGEDTFPTYEGNSNSGGSREGWEFVSRSARQVDPKGAYFCQFVRWIDIAGAPSGSPAPQEFRSVSESPFVVNFGAGEGVAVSALRIVADGDGKVIVPLRRSLCELFPADFVTKNLVRSEEGHLLWCGKLIPGMPYYRQEKAYLWVRDFAKLVGLEVADVDVPNSRLRLVHPA